MTTRDIDDADRDWITAQAQNGVALLARYNVAEPTSDLPAKIGSVILVWRQDVAPDRPDEGDVLRALGCLLGQYAVTSGAGKWVVVTDSCGSTLGIQRDVSGWIFYPLDVISKRMKSQPVEEIASAYEVFATGPPAMGR